MNGLNERFKLVVVKHREALFIVGRGFIEMVIEVYWYLLPLLCNFIVGIDLLLNDVREVANVVKFGKVFVDSVQFYDFITFDRK
jgi:hypothetical protein